MASLLAPFESLVNRNIGASTPAREILKELSGRAFAIEVGTPLGGRLLRVHLAADEAGVKVGSGEDAADATISGTPLAMLSLLGDRGLGRLRSAGIKVSGDAQIAQSFEKLLGYARPDLEEELARLAGDAPAHFLAGAARGAFAWVRRAGDSLARDVGEYLNEEGRDLVPSAELEVFLGDVDRIRDDTERAESRLAILERALGTVRS